MRSDLVDIEGRLMQSRETSIAIDIGVTEKDDRGRERAKWFWLPRSMIEVDLSSPVAIDKITVTMPEWLAVEKGLV